MVGEFDELLALTPEHSDSKSSFTSYIYLSQIFMPFLPSISDKIDTSNQSPCRLSQKTPRTPETFWPLQSPSKAIRNAIHHKLHLLTTFQPAQEWRIL